MLQQSILELDLFDVLEIDFIGSFPQSCGHIYILLVMDYVSKWVEAISYAKNDAITVSKFLKKSIFTRFGTPQAVISDEGSHFITRIIAKLLSKYKFHGQRAYNFYFEHLLSFSLLLSLSLYN